MKNNTALIRDNLDSAELHRVTGVVSLRNRGRKNSKWFGEFYLGFLLFVDGKCLGRDKGLNLMWLGMLICGNACSSYGKVLAVNRKSLGIITDMYDRIIRPLFPGDPMGPIRFAPPFAMHVFSEEAREYCVRSREELITSWDKRGTDTLGLALKNMTKILRIMYFHLSSGDDFVGRYVTQEDWDMIDEIIPDNDWGRNQPWFEHWLLEA